MVSFSDGSAMVDFTVLLCAFKYMRIHAVYQFLYMMKLIFRLLDGILHGKHILGGLPRGDD